jgi:hypothetical protein
MSAGSNQSPSQQNAGVPDPGVGTLQGPSPLEGQVPDPGVGTLQGPTPVEAQVPDPGVGTLQSPTPQPAATIDDFSLTVATLPPIVTAQEVSTIGGQATTVVQSFPDTVFQIRAEPRHKATQGQNTNTNPYHAKRSQDFADTAAYAMSLVPIAAVQDSSPVKEGNVYPRARVRGQEGLM